MDKFSELKAAALAATPGPWRALSFDERLGISGDGSAILVCEHITKQRPHDALFIAAANPAAILALLAELKAKTDFYDKGIERISGLEKACDKYLRQAKKAERELLAAKERLAELEAYNAKLRDWNSGLAQESCELQSKLATPVRLSESTVMSRRYVVDAIRAAGFTVEGDE